MPSGHEFSNTCRRWLFWNHMDTYWFLYYWKWRIIMLYSLLLCYKCSCVPLPYLYLKLSCVFFRLKNMLRCFSPKASLFFDHWRCLSACCSVFQCLFRVGKTKNSIHRYIMELHNVWVVSPPPAINFLVILKTCMITEHWAGVFLKPSLMFLKSCSWIAEP